jgi:glycosyltransferase involved in cell wall biosynthesis
MQDSTESFYHYPPATEEVAVHMPCLEHGVDGRKKLSVVVPLYNEKDNIREVVEDLEETLILSEMEFEIVLVDDGSTDDTFKIARGLERECPYVKVICHETNKGKSAAMMTGFRNVEGDYIVLMDGDGQFSARDIPRMIEKLEEGYDVINGWGEKQEPITKIIPSLIYNGICRRIFSLNVRQFNLGFKAFRRETVEGLHLKKDEHRYILPLLKEKQCKITEVPVAYLPRQNGKSKYGIMRIPNGVMDMVALKIELTLGERPFRFFGFVSCGLILLAILLGLYAGYEVLFNNIVHMWSIAFSVVFLLFGITLLFIGYAIEEARCPRR